MSISQRQKQLVQESFAKVEPISEQAADIFYTTLFEYDPSLKSLFKNSIKSQGQKLMATLKVAVNSLDDIDALVPVLQKLAERHVNYGVKPEHFTLVGNALLYTLKKGLGSDWNSELRQAWIDVFKVVATVMKNHAFNTKH
ncbi:MULTISPECIES: globin family protein [Pseudoalteromonas]|uniref:Globin family protein n=1 Tax=Pseudoalteromonas obscura TaxID=3048491 RepID=A0ABT7EJ47_9GAMM|nr:MULTISPECIES: globin family protein [Pseudoalteromonas]MBQ4836646.1 hemin receptor [Pseudoalteromonas luteoviolacea]MDK2595074.1 globin family protein [Pseudoalteromonas sp. P94(2023)]